MKTRNITKRETRHRRVRSKISGTSDRPRLAVFKSNRYLIAQLIDDAKSETIAYITTQTDKTKKTPLEKSKDLGLKIAELAKTKKIKSVVFDRGGVVFHGRIKALADGAREGGLKF
jgi:large subunit ribosomal protein L18